jgi:hypothetical protein
MTQIEKKAVERFDCVGLDAEMASGIVGEWVRYEDHRAALDAAEAEKRAAVAAERQKWEAILKARDAYENGEPSKPPHSGREKTTIAAVFREDKQ